MVSVQSIFTALNTKLDFLKTWPLPGQSSYFWNQTTLCWELLYDGKEGAAAIVEIPSVLHEAARSSWDLDFSALRCTGYQVQRCSPRGALQLHAALFTRGLQNEAVLQTETIFLRNFVSWSGCMKNLPWVTTCQLVWTHSFMCILQT